MHMYTYMYISLAIATVKFSTQQASAVGRPALTDEFLREETLIENLAAIDEDTKTDMGYSFHEMILDCQFKGVHCDAS